ncbi:hypothetical protein HK102_008975, partial [Quaeritorhiza haematococci]
VIGFIDSTTNSITYVPIDTRPASGLATARKPNNIPQQTITVTIITTTITTITTRTS